MNLLKKNDGNSLVTWKDLLPKMTKITNQFKWLGLGTIIDNGNSGSSKTIDWTAGTQQMITTTDDCTLTFTAPASPCVLRLLILHENSSSSYAYTFPSDVAFPEVYEFVATPATAYAVDVLTLWYLGDAIYTETGFRYIAMGNNNFGG